MLQALVKAASWSFSGCCTILYALLTVKSVVRRGGWGLITSFLRLCNLMLTWQILFQFKCKTRDGTAIIFISCSSIWYRSFFLWLIEVPKSVKTRKVCFFISKYYCKIICEWIKPQMWSNFDSILWLSQWLNNLNKSFWQITDN